MQGRIGGMRKKVVTSAISTNAMWSWESDHACLSDNRRALVWCTDCTHGRLPIKHKQEEEDEQEGFEILTFRRPVTPTFVPSWEGYPHSRSSQTAPSLPLASTVAPSAYDAAWPHVALKKKRKSHDNDVCGQSSNLPTSSLLDWECQTASWID